MTDRITANVAGRRWQQGGTVAGVIIGLIVGLVIAVWVAMTIMKTPLPFVDKLGKQTQPAGELGDPNKTLPGGARERRERLEEDDSAVPASARSAKAEPATPPATVAGASNPPPADKPRADKPASATAAPAVPPSPGPTAVPPAATAPAPAGSEGFTYYLQAGAFREQSDAEATKAKLALMGVAATIAERKSELGTLYRVRVGPFPELEAMNRARVRLSDNGVDAAVVRVPK
jgi:cell division protein FtsN